jgi:uncharacterized membrane protein YraQ (UPF0718 family)
MCHNRPMRAHLSTLVLAIVAVALGVIAYLKDPGPPAIGVRNGVSMLVFILPRMVPAILIAGLIQVLIPQETVSHCFGQRSGVAGIVVASLVGVFTPGGPMVSVPFMVVAWEAPLMGWRFVAVRVIPSFAFPVLAGWLVKVFYQE